VGTVLLAGCSIGVLCGAKKHACFGDFLLGLPQGRLQPHQAGTPQSHDCKTAHGLHVHVQAGLDAVPPQVLRLTGLTSLNLSKNQIKVIWWCRDLMILRHLATT
jgi:hypothetical protein